MRGPFQEPIYRHPLRNRPAVRNTFFGTAAALGGAFIKSILPKGNVQLNSIKPFSLYRPNFISASKLRNHATLFRSSQKTSYPFRKKTFVSKKTIRSPRSFRYIKIRRTKANEYRNLRRNNFSRRRRNFSRNSRSKYPLKFSSRNRARSIYRRSGVSKRSRYSRTNRKRHR